MRRKMSTFEADAITARAERAENADRLMFAEHAARVMRA